MSRSADLKINNFADDFTNSDIAKAIVDYFVARNMKVLCVQQCANKIARVTFDSREASEVVQLRGELDIGGVKVAVVPPPPPPPNWVNVVVYNLPYDAPNEYVSDALKFFGTVQQVRYQSWTNIPGVSTGTRVARINLNRSIPRFLKIHTFRCKVWYRGQPVYCDICKAGTHLASGCPFKGKCLSCEGVGHLARQCPKVCYKCKGDHASNACPNSRRWEHRRADEDDFHSVASDLGTAADVTVPAESSNSNAETADPAPVFGPASAAEPGPTAGPAAAAAGPAAAVGSTDGSVRGPVPQFDFLAPRPPLPTVSRPATALDDERFNQLDEVQTQEDSPSQSVLDGLSGVVNEVCESAIDALESAGSSESDGTFAKPQDVSMSEPLLSQKRSMAELLSSDESPRSRSRNRKSSRVTSSHMPTGVSAAANLARSRSSSLNSRSPSVSRSSSKSKS